VGRGMDQGQNISMLLVVPHRWDRLTVSGHSSWVPLSSVLGKSSGHSWARQTTPETGGRDMITQWAQWIRYTRQ